MVCVHMWKLENFMGLLLSFFLELRGLNFGHQACTGSAFTQRVIALTLKSLKLLTNI